MTQPETPRPKKPAKRRSQGPVTPATTDTPPDLDAPPVDLAAAAAKAAAKPGPPPGGPGGGSPSARRPPSRMTKADKLRESLADLLSAPALLYSATGDQWAAEFVAQRAPVMANAWVDLAEENPAVKRILERITTGSAWGGVIFATGGTLLPLLAHHGLLPDLGLGPAEEGAPIVPPPAASPPPPGPATGGGGVGRTPPPTNGHTTMTPPVAPDQPPGVVTVAGSTNNAR